MPGLSKAKILDLAKGFRGRSKNCQMLARNRVEHGLQHAYRNRKYKARNFRASWLQSIGAGVQEVGLNYSRFISEAGKSKIELNRHMLALLAQTEPLSFRALSEHVYEEAKSRETPNHPLPNVEKLSDYGHVCSSLVVSTVPKGKIEIAPKARRSSTNYF